jgi:hypothetical protein
MNSQQKFISAVENLDLKKIIKLINEEDVNPESNENWAINYAFVNNKMDVVHLLWKNRAIKNTLRKNYNNIYSHMTKLDIQNKVNDFNYE